MPLELVQFFELAGYAANVSSLFPKSAADQENTRQKLNLVAIHLEYMIERNRFRFESSDDREIFGTAIKEIGAFARSNVGALATSHNVQETLSSLILKIEDIAAAIDVDRLSPTQARETLKVVKESLQLFQR